MSSVLKQTLPSKRGDVSGGDPAISTTMSISQLLAVPSIRTLALSSFALAFLGNGYTVVFVLFCYTPIEEGGLAFSVSNQDICQRPERFHTLCSRFLRLATL